MQRSRSRSRGVIKSLIPNGFRWRPSFGISGSGLYGYTTNFDYDAIKPSGGTTVYIATTGNDTTGDGSSGNPYRTLAKGEAVGANIFMIKQGVYTRSHCFAAASWNPTRDVMLVSADGPGKAILTRAWDGLTWTQQIFPNDNVYLATVSTLVDQGVLDLTATGQAGRFLPDGTTLVPQPLSKQTSIANVQANAGSYYYTGTSLYVRTFNNRAPDANVLPISTDSFTWFTSATNKKSFVDGCVIWGRGGCRTEHTTANTNIIGYRNTHCGFTDWTVGAYRVEGSDYAYMINCSGSNSTVQDAFSSASTTINALPKVLQVNCKAWDCGVAGPNNYNAFTSHNNSATIRLNCIGERTYGPIYADVLGSHSLNLGCYGTTSQASAGTGQAIYQSGTVSGFDSSNSKVFTKDCSAAGSNYARVQVTGGEFYDGGGFADTTTLHDFGTIQSY